MPPSANSPSLALCIDADRRTHRRFPVSRPGKIFRRATQQYTPATTCNLSLGGALLEIDTDRPLAAGELVDLAIAYREQTILPATMLQPAIVTRVATSPSGRQCVAVRYLDRGTLSLAA